MKRPATVVALVLFGVLWQGRARADGPGYALIIGYNGQPAGEDTDAPPPLRFADDDAMAFYELRRELGDHAVLLAAPDPDTRRRYPQSVEAAQPPSLATMETAMAQLEAAMQADVRAGRTPDFLFFYSGHGLRGADGQVALALLDGMLTQRALFDRILDRVPAGVIHLVVDACHAETLARPRDGEARVVPLSTDDVAAYLSQRAPARYQRVGMAIASSRDGAAHEWDLYQSGVFTHEVLSALRGAADVNGDGRVEYSELGAFLAAANREVQDPRARLQAIVRAPVSAPRTPIADLSRMQGTSRLVKIPAGPDSFFIEDAWGNRLVDGRPELGSSMSISLPADQRLYVRRGEQETELVLRPGTESDFRSLVFRARSMRMRGAVEGALRAGLFLAQFGPAYYRGYVDREDAVAVPMPPEISLLREATTEAPPPQPRRRSLARPSLAGAAAAMLAASGVVGVLAYGAWRDNRSAVERESADAANRFRVDTALTAGFLIAGVAFAAAAFFVDRDR